MKRPTAKELRERRALILLGASAHSVASDVGEYLCRGQYEDSVAAGVNDLSVLVSVIRAMMRKGLTLDDIQDIFHLETEYNDLRTFCSRQGADLDDRHTPKTYREIRQTRKPRKD